VWIPLLLVVVVVIGSYAVVRIRDLFGAQATAAAATVRATKRNPFNPKHITVDNGAARGQRHVDYWTQTAAHRV